MNNLNDINKVGPSKKERAYHYILSTPKGVTENDILSNVHLSSGRNYPSELERKYSLKFKRIRVPNPDGIGCHTRYIISNRDDAIKVLTAINHKRTARKASHMPETEAKALLSYYEPAVSTI